MNLVLLHNDRPKHSYTLPKNTGRFFQIGYESNCSVRLPANKGVEQYHALIIRTEKGGFRICSRTAKATTMVNGRSIVDRDLRAGDKVHIGSYAFLVTE
ncbi:MAG: FHA domain-containing protein [Patescibacteria group bacterium]|jgi:predicted component of type VI protein secretion system